MTYVCAGCGKPIFADTTRFLTVTDHLDLQEHRPFGGMITRFLHDYACLSQYAGHRLAGHAGYPGLPQTSVKRKKR